MLDDRAGRLPETSGRAAGLVKGMKLLSIVVPVYNEELNVEPLYQAVNSALQGIADRYRWEFVFTDNCSTDHTFERLEALAARDSRVRAYQLTRNFGFQRSILTGLRSPGPTRAHSRLREALGGGIPNRVRRASLPR